MSHVGVTRILAESESLAFAGLLIDVGKRQPALFAHTLRPVLSNWLICEWDLQLANLRPLDHGSYWGQTQLIIQLAQDWYRLPHRLQPLAGIGGPVMQTMIGQQEFRAFFDELRANWSRDLEGEEGKDAERLRLLIERFNPDNYTFEVRDGTRVPVDFAWPEAIERQNAESIRMLNDEMALTQLPYRARKRLASTAPLPEAEASSLLEYLQHIDASARNFLHREASHCCASKISSAPASPRLSSSITIGSRRSRSGATGAAKSCIGSSTIRRRDSDSSPR